MSNEILDYVFLLSIGIIYVVLVFVVLFTSDQSKKYRYITISTYLPAFLLTIPHLLFPDPTNAIDIFTHIIVGLSVFLSFTNVLRSPSRGIWSLFSSFLVIFAIEYFLSVLEVTIGYSNPLTLDTYEDMLFHLIGSIIGYLLFIKYRTDVSAEFKIR
jgi:hypothetical protein